MDFSANLTAGGDAQHRGKEEKEKRKEEKGLPHASAASLTPIFGKHGYRRPQLQLEKTRRKERVRDR